MDTGNELDEILSGDTAPAAAAIPEAIPAAPATETAPAAQPRAADGKFAPKAGEPPATVTTTPPSQAPGGDTSSEALAGPGFVPQQALHAARQENADLKRSLDEMRGQISLLSQRQQQPPAPPKEAPKPKEFWDAPDAFVDERLTPVQDQIRTVVLTYSRRDAIRDHGQEKVAAAEDALKQAIASGQVNGKDVVDRLKASLDPVGDVVNWHSRQSAMQKVGSDPDKWLESELERRLSDPAEQARILERIKASAATPGSGQTPAIQLPPSLNKLPGGGNAAPSGGLGNDAERFARALTG